MNMRKIIAVLAAVLMLCAAIPMGIMSVSAAEDGIILNKDFNDGTNDFSKGEIVAEGPDGSNCFKWSATGGWGYTETMASNVQLDTDYTVTFKAKGSVAGGMGITIERGDWSSHYFNGPSFQVTTEWQEFTLTFNSGDYVTADGLMLFKFQDVGVAMDLYVDDLVITEGLPKVEPIINGGFETGNTDGWNTHQNVTVIGEAAHDGNYGARLQDNGTWGGIMDQTLTVEAGKAYEISFWIQVNKTGINLQIRDGGASGASLASGTWYDYNNHSTWTQKTYIVEPTTDAIFLNFCGAGGETPNPDMVTDTYIDSFIVKELKQPSFDGYITNGDFEVGDLQSWDPIWWAGNVALVEGGYNSDYAMQYTSAGDYQSVRQLVNVEPNTDYIVQCYAKNVSNATLLAKSVSPDANIKQAGMSGGDAWTLNTLEFNSGDNTQVYICVMGNVAGATAIVDDITMAKVEEPDATIVWNIDFNDGDKKFNVGEVVAEGPDGSNCYKWDFGGGYSSNYAGGLSMDFTKDYTVTMKVKGSIDNTMAITLMPGSWATWWNGPSFAVTTEWQEVVLAIPANSVIGKDGNSFNAGIFEFQGTGNEPAYTLYVDDIVITEGLPPAPSNLLQNGDFETGKVAPWENLWGSCPTVEIVEGMDGGYGLHIVSGQWKHVRQTAIVVETNTWYKVTAWVKNAKGMSLLVKDGADTKDIVNKGVEAGEEWTEFTFEFNTGDYNSIIFSLMGNNAEEAYGTFDNIVLEVAPCQHEYDDCFDLDCNLCGETREPSHNLTYHEAVVATNCQETGHAEYWYCENCGCYFGDAEATWQHNPGWLFTTGDCVRPEGAADCATVPCELCGNDIYGYGEHDTGVPACQDGRCSKCDQAVAGYGHQNYDGPACLPGNCYYCGEAMEPVAHENGAWAPCLEGECSYGCGLTYPATADHVDEDGDNSCDNCWSAMPHDCIDEDGNYECDICWSTMPHDCIDEDGDHHCDICWGVMPHDCIDEDGDAWCDICWNPMPEEPPVVEIVYGDADGDGEITLLDATVLTQYLSGYEVTLTEDAADADGDGEITLLDATVLTQFLSGYDVTLGPQG